MDTALVHAPSAQQPVPLLLQGVNGVVPSRKSEYVYLKVTLHQAIPTLDCEMRLRDCGLECITAGEPHTLYGIIPNDYDTLECIVGIPEVAAVERSEPAAGK